VTGQTFDRTSLRRSVATNSHTLVIPTYNRPNDLRQNLEFLERQGLQSSCLVLDSSLQEARQVNQESIRRCQLDLDYIEYATDTHPFDKFADGIRRAATPFVSLCADDDLLILQGLASAISALETDPDAAVAHGYYFLFGSLHRDNGLDITTMLYASPSILDENPFNRLNTLMSSYQALTYGVYRKEVLAEVYDHVSVPKSLLFRELLTGAVPVLRGKVIRVPEFYMARRHATGDDAHRTCWHPLEWFMRDRTNMAEDYQAYSRVLHELLGGAAAAQAERNKLLLDVIHLGYLSDHIPRQVRSFLLREEFAGRTIDDYWNNSELQRALIEVHNAGFEQAGAVPLTSLVAPAFGSGQIDEATGICRKWPAILKTAVRDYRFYDSFLDNRLSSILSVDAAALLDLVNCLDLFDSN
jgi:glycosyltransferase domain-containing protein